MLAPIYNPDPNFTYSVNLPENIMYTNTFEDIFSDNEFDTSILISGNIDCDFFNYLDTTYFEKMIDLTEGSPTYRQMIDCENFEGYEQPKLLGFCLIQSPNWASYAIYNLTELKSVSGGDLKTSRFCLGGEETGFERFVATLGNIYHEPLDRTIVSGNNRYINTFQNKTGFEDIENYVVRSFSTSIYYAIPQTNQHNLINFESNYAPLPVAVLQYKGNIYICNIHSLTSITSSGYTQLYMAGAQVPFKLGMAVEDAFQQMSTNTERPCQITRPVLGNVTENKTGLMTEIYVSASRWYAAYYNLVSGALIRRLYTIMGLYFFWDRNRYGLMADEDYYADICLGQRDEYGIIAQDAFNKGMDVIREKDPYFDKLNYKDLPDVNPDATIIDDDDDIDDMPIGNNVFDTGFVKYYQVTSSNLEDISFTLSTQTEYTDLNRNIVSLKSYVLPTSQYITSTKAENIKIGALTIRELTCPRINTMKTDWLIGTYPINGKFGSGSNPHFLDKSPYTHMEVYIPFCGTIAIPDTCMYKYIEVHLVADILTGSCIGVIKCNGNIVAEKSGIIGTDVPLTSQDNASKSNALISGVLNSVPIATSAVSNVMTGNVGGTINAVTSGIQNVNNMRIAEHANYTRVVGSTASRTENALPDTCYIKIFRPIVSEPADYAYKYGKPCNKQLKLSECKGFTQCFNPVINGNMTNIEREKIISLLNSGIYI